MLYNFWAERRLLKGTESQIIYTMGILQFIKNKKEFLLPDKERLMLFFSLLGFLPIPAYFIAGTGLIPAFYIAIVFFAFIMPGISGLAQLLMLVYVSSLPVFLYLLVSIFSLKTKNRYLKWGVALALVLLACFVKIYVIADAGGVRTTYTAIELYGEVF